MDSNHFDALVRSMASRPSRRQMLGWLLGTLLGGRLGQALAHERIAAAGNGGKADARADAGAVRLGDINSGGNAGNAIGVGDTVGDVEVSGGSVDNTTRIDVTADGGAAIADASGGDGNVAGVFEPGPESGDSDADDSDQDNLEDNVLEDNVLEEDDLGEDDFGEDHLGEEDSEAIEPSEPGIDLPEPTPTPEEPSPTPEPPPEPEPEPEPTPEPTPSPTPPPEPTCPCPRSVGGPRYYCAGTPNGCCRYDRCGINVQSGAYCCNCGTGQCSCDLGNRICVGS